MHHTSLQMDSFEELMYEQVTLINSVNRALSNFKKLGQIKMTYAVTKNRMAIMKDKFDQCRKLDAKLHATADTKEKAAHPYFSEHGFDKCEEAYESAMDYFADVLHELSPSSTPLSPNVSHLHECQSHPTLNLPKITLPVFDGSFDKWESFRDRFHSMIIDEKTCLTYKNCIIYFPVSKAKRS